MKSNLDRVDVERTDMVFPLDQVIYSRTDNRGTILACNAAFQQMSGFALDQLIGASHQIMRSPDTPSVIFRLMWQRLKQGQPVVAYLRNRTQSGQNYWVVLAISPVMDGFLSIGLKPTTAIFGAIKGIYARLSAAERTEGVTPEVAEQRLAAELSTLGFADHSAFMAQALSQEFRACAVPTHQVLPSYFADSDRIATSLRAISEQQAELLRNFVRLRDLPTNMRIIASRLEPTGGPISAISDIYNSESTQLFREISDFAEGRKSLGKRMAHSYETALLQRVSCLLKSAVSVSPGPEEPSLDGLDIASESDLLAAFAEACDAEERAGLIDAEQLSNAMTTISSELRRSMLGLDTIRVMGRVESGRLGEEGARIGATIDQIDTYHSGIISILQQIMDNSMIIHAGLGGMRTHAAQRPAMAAR